VLYAVADETWEPGDRVEWQSHEFEVVGSLRIEVIGRVPVYHKVGLRRVPTRTLGRVTGAVA